MTENKQSMGITTIAPDVLLTIIKLTAMEVDGVYSLAPIPGKVDAFLKRSVEEGIRLNLENGVAYVDIHIIIKKEYNARDISRSVQKQVSRAISEMVGMESGRVNIHVEDIHYDVAGEFEKP